MASRGFSLIELLVVMTILAVVTSLAVTALMDGNPGSERAVCLNNLKEIGQLAFLYSLDHAGFFPTARSDGPPPAYRSLQLLVAQDPTISSRLFVCPASDAKPAELIDGAFTLDERSNSYAWLARRGKATAAPHLPLAADDALPRKPGDHAGGVNVLYRGLDAEWIPWDAGGRPGALPPGLVGNRAGSG